MLSYCVFISKVLIHFGVGCISESSESYNKANGWQFKSEYVEEDEEVGESSSIPYRARLKFEGTLLREIRSLKIMYQGTREDVTKMKEHLIFEKRNEEGADEEESGE
ncbi:hypothetical protein V8G54_001133 [Vigna mungo]|uniref:Uncharacterized protein n=1 Tax=Vigna mungo TaxID=3915 RepID=A0AAQ3P799_VIGMU